MSGAVFPTLLLLPEIGLPETLSFQLLSGFEGKEVNHPSNITITTTESLQTVKGYRKLTIAQTIAHKCIISPGHNKQ